jgi:L-ascorbate metabolism protein UlaG (beta-lactamase superfamily)
MENNFYLKPNVVIEPLIDRWYAWPHLISPATAAMNIRGRHLKIINSFIQSPQIHAAAVANPKMKGGPFIDYSISRTEEIKKLKQQILVERAGLLQFAESIIELDKLLKNTAKGFSLEALYSKVPDILKGYVELVYDLNNNASFRFFEALLYKSELFDKSMQSIALWITNNDERAFCLSTPRLDEANVLHLNIPFNHEAIDVLARMKRTKGSIDEVAELLKIRPSQRPLFDSFFTTIKHPQYNKYNGEKARMRYFGHACILLETPQVSILIDPLISYYGYDSDINHFSDIDLPNVIDYVLITHNHQDHILFETLLPLRHKIKNIIVPSTSSGALQDPNLRLVFESLGFTNVFEVDEMQEIKFKDCTITSLPFTGEHSDLNIRTKTCYHILIKKLSFIFFADSRIMEPNIYKHIHKIMGNVDVIFLGMECDGAPLSWLYGPLLSDDLPRDKDQSRRLAGSDFEKGMHLIDIFKPKETYVYAMGQEPWLEFISSIKYTPESNPIIQSGKLVDECSKQGIIAERLFGEKELLYKQEKGDIYEIN